MATISVCLVTRDDEKYLERSLLPIKDFVDELIIVDLKSKDGTAEIARRFTDKFSVRPFDNDLSAARNAAVREASMDWILFIDADEIIFKEEMRALKKFLSSKADADAYILPTRNYTNNRKLMGWSASSVIAGFEGFTVSKSIRLFRNFKGISYRYPVNPTLLPTLHALSARISEIDDVVVHNLGYNPFEVIRFDWLVSQVRDFPHDIANRYSLASILMQKGQLDKAKEHFGEIAKIDAKFKRTLTNLGTILMMQSRNDEAARVFLKAIEVDENDVGAYNNLGVLFKMAKNFEKAEYMFKKAIQVDQKDPRLFRSLALVYLDKQDGAAAKRVVDAGLSLHPKDKDLLDLKSKV